MRYTPLAQSYIMLHFMLLVQLANFCNLIKANLSEFNINSTSVCELSECSEVYTQVPQVCMASLRATKTSHSLAAVNRAPLSPPKISIKVRYLHEVR